MKYFKKSILVCDRAYHSLPFFKFLNDNKISFIIRMRKNALEDSLKPFKIISCNCESNSIYTDNDKNVKYQVTSTELFKLATNIYDDLPNHYFSDIYNSRWDIEIFFKHLKNNFKFSHITDKHSINNIKSNICRLIIFYLAKIIKQIILMNNNKIKLIDINTSNLIRGIFNYLLDPLINSKLTKENIIFIINNITDIHKNKKSRCFDRRSKKPFKKWYVKYYSINTFWKRIISAYLSKEIDKLNKNEKIKANNIVKITVIKL